MSSVGRSSCRPSIGTYIGLISQYQGLTGSTVLQQVDTTWSTNNVGPYLSSTTTTMDPGTPYATAKRVDQVVDTWGNMTSVMLYNYDGSTRRTYANTYSTASGLINCTYPTGCSRRQWRRRASESQVVVAADHGFYEPNEGDDILTQMNSGEVTVLLREVSAGKPDARDRLFQVMYPELKRMAVARMSRERKDHTLQPTALVNEVYLRLPGGATSMRDRAHFLAVAANAMRRILVDHARSRLSEKRGSGRKDALDEAFAYDPGRPEEMIDLDRALTKLEAMNARHARVVELRFFGGLTEQQIGQVLRVSDRTVKRDWEIARAWLYGELIVLAHPRSE